MKSTITGIMRRKISKGKLQGIWENVKLENCSKKLEWNENQHMTEIGEK